MVTNGESSGKISTINGEDSFFFFLDGNFSTCVTATRVAQPPIRVCRLSVSALSTHKSLVIFSENRRRGRNGRHRESYIDGRSEGSITSIVSIVLSLVQRTCYGTFNVLLLLAALPVAWAGIFDTTTTAFVIASAECDLRLTYFEKGTLCASPFLVRSEHIGMALTSFVWDHLTPHVGMRNLFILGLLADSVLNLLASAVDSYYAFLAIRFFNGVL
ncbi:hypothetical protein E2986_12493 [Frieseomelitta varia]|uniref:Major facilitator superfamily (MFS) profile domain-containing protein n=1 Tax=Frieseomelitta varia TaxID=561572 RepID=A0A833R6S6_9HYME|nr:hypothetical protein E2986_12493 [Frieseomelitta varia]